METYLLLRSNKKSGPYNLQELLNFGLKPYDLVWVEGKSAAWRYPGEVEALKAYTAVTEEQPYDRFYKKAEDRKVPEPVSAFKEAPVVQISSTPKETQVFEVRQEAIIPRIETQTTTTPRKVFVSMPENHVPKPVQPQPVLVKMPVIDEKPKIIEQRNIETMPAYTKPVPTINERIAYEQKDLPKEKEPELTENYSESLDDIKKRYAETYLQRKKNSKRSSAVKSLAQVVGGAVFFCVAVVILYKGFGEDSKAQPVTKTTVTQPEKSNNTTVAIPAAVISTPATGKTTRQNEKKSPIKKDEVAGTNENPITSNTPAAKQKKADVAKRNDDLFAFDTKEVRSKTYEQSRSEEAKPRVRPVNINKLVSVRANNYKQRAFGGVLNLELTVRNDSKFDIDKVIVELQYLKPSEEPIKTERITFSSIGANSSETVKVPDYLRGVKISFRVLEVESTQYERSTAGL